METAGFRLELGLSAKVSLGNFLSCKTSDSASHTDLLAHATPAVVQIISCLPTAHDAPPETLQWLATFSVLTLFSAHAVQSLDGRSIERVRLDRGTREVVFPR